MGNSNNLSNINSLFKEIYSDNIEELLGLRHFKWNKEKTKFYWDTNYSYSILGLRQLLSSNATEPDSKILLFELIDG